MNAIQYSKQDTINLFQNGSAQKEPHHPVYPVQGIRSPFVYSNPFTEENNKQRKIRTLKFTYRQELNQQTRTPAGDNEASLIYEEKPRCFERKLKSRTTMRKDQSHYESTPVRNHMDNPCTSIQYDGSLDTEFTLNKCNSSGSSSYDSSSRMHRHKLKEFFKKGWLSRRESRRGANREENDESENARRPDDNTNKKKGKKKKEKKSKDEDGRKSKEKNKGEGKDINEPVFTKRYVEKSDDEMEKEEEEGQGIMQRTTPPPKPKRGILNRFRRTDASPSRSATPTGHSDDEDDGDVLGRVKKYNTPLVGKRVLQPLTLSRPKSEQGQKTQKPFRDPPIGAPDYLRGQGLYEPYAPTQGVIYPRKFASDPPYTSPGVNVDGLKQPVGLSRFQRRKMVPVVPADPKAGVIGDLNIKLPAWVSPLYKSYGIGGPYGPYGPFYEPPFYGIQVTKEIAIASLKMDKERRVTEGKFRESQTFQPPKKKSILRTWYHRWKYGVEGTKAVAVVDSVIDKLDDIKKTIDTKKQLDDIVPGVVDLLKTSALDVERLRKTSGDELIKKMTEIKQQQESKEGSFLGQESDLEPEDTPLPKGKEEGEKTEAEDEAKAEEKEENDEKAKEATAERSMASAEEE